MRIIVMVTCCFSMLGALLIILSYMCCKDLRSKGRQILLHISIMDFGVSLFNLAGTWFHFSHHYHPVVYSNCATFISGISQPPHSSVHQEHASSSNTVMCPQSVTVQALCLTQASLSTFFTSGSILWTISLSFYLYIRIAHKSSILARCTLYSSYVLCYATPAALTLWLLTTGRLGYSPHEWSGSCSIILVDPVTEDRDIYATVFGFNIWVVIVFIFPPILAYALHCSVRTEVSP